MRRRRRRRRKRGKRRRREGGRERSGVLTELLHKLCIKCYRERVQSLGSVTTHLDPSQTPGGEMEKDKGLKRVRRGG